MAEIRTDNNPKESGIALVTALVITVVVLMLISSLTYLFTKGFQTNIINRQFSTVYEAANGGVEYTTGVVNSSLLNGTSPANIGTITVTGGNHLLRILFTALRHTEQHRNNYSKDSRWSLSHNNDN